MAPVLVKAPPAGMPPLPGPGPYAPPAAKYPPRMLPLGRNNLSLCGSNAYHSMIRWCSNGRSIRRERLVLRALLCPHAALPQVPRLLPWGRCL